MALDPSVWASTPYGNPTALLDTAGALQQWHKALADTIFALTGTAYALYPIGDAPGTPEWLFAIQQQYNLASAALGLGSPANLQSFDLADPQDFSSFMFLITQESLALRSAAGLA